MKKKLDIEVKKMDGMETTTSNLSVPNTSLWEMLSTEVVEIILLHLSMQDIVQNITRVNSNLHEVTLPSNHVFWKRLLTLQWSNMIPPEVGDDLPIERVEYGILSAGGYWQAGKALMIAKKYGDAADGWSVKKIVYPNPAWFVGWLVAGKSNGRGVAKYINGSAYEAEWKHGKLEGRRAMQYARVGVVYEGEWRCGLREGRGTIKYVDGAVYEGEWKYDRMEGKGILKCGDRVAYEGEWKDGLKDGRGTRTYTSGEVYEGEWRRGEKEGKGTIKCVGGGVYEGEWKNNRMEGRGKMKSLDGSVYEGEWKDNQMEGTGTLRFANGIVYEGRFRKNRNEGRGTLKLGDEVMFEGEWKHGEPVLRMNHRS